SAERHQRNRAGFAIPGSKSQARPRTITRCDRTSSAETAPGRKCPAGKNAPPQIAASSGPQAKDSRIKTKAWRVEETSKPNQRLGLLPEQFLQSFDSRFHQFAFFLNGSVGVALLEPLDLF